MINISQVKQYCKDYTKIENYDKAIADKSQTWHCHHRKEDLGYSPSELKSMKEYYNVPPEDLIFLTRSEHNRIHHKGNKNMKGKHHSDETKAKISAKKKGNKNMKGKHHSDETKAKMSAKNKGKPKKKFKWLTQSGEIVEMNKANVTRWHKDWILLVA